MKLRSQASGDNRDDLEGTQVIKRDGEGRSSMWDTKASRNYLVEIRENIIDLGWVWWGWKEPEREIDL